MKKPLNGLNSACPHTSRVKSEKNRLAGRDAGFDKSLAQLEFFIIMKPKTVQFSHFDIEIQIGAAYCGHFFFFFGGVKIGKHIMMIVCANNGK